MSTTVGPLDSPSRPCGRARGAEPQLTLVSGLASLSDLRDEWLELWRQGTATPFQAPGCVLAWAASHAPDRTHAVVVRERGRLVALAPVFTWEGALLLAGTGPTDYGDALIAPGREALAAALLGGMVRLTRRAGARSIQLKALRSDSPLLQTPAPAGWSSAVTAADVCPTTPLEGPDGLGALQSARRRKILAAERRALRAGRNLSFSLAEAATVGSLTAGLRDLHAARWSTRGEPGVLHEPLMAGFVGQALPALLADGALRLHALHVDGRLAAVLCALHDGRAAHLWLSGFDPAFEALGPGSLLLLRAFRQARAENLREVRFLRGREPYKYDWGAHDEVTFDRQLRLRLH